MLGPKLVHPTLVHPKTGDPLVSLGLFRGRPIWPVIGAAEDDDQDDDDTDDGDDDQDDDKGKDGKKTGDDLGDAGKAALKKERTARQRAQRAARPWTQLGRELGLTPEQVRERLASKKDDGKGKDDEDGVKGGDAAADLERKTEARIIRAEVKSAAAGRLVDPSLAVKLLDLSQFQLDRDGELDEDEVSDALDELIEKYPYLAAKAKKDDDDEEGSGRRGGRRPRPDRSQGARDRDKDKTSARERGRAEAERRFGKQKTTQQ